MKFTYQITGLDCANCAAKFEKAVKDFDGICDAKFNFILEKMIISTDDEKTAKAALKSACKAFPEAVVE